MATNFIFKNTWVYKVKFAPLKPISILHQYDFTKFLNLVTMVLLA